MDCPFAAYICPMTTLNELKAGERAEVVKIETDKDVKERLKMLNIFVGAKVRMVKTAFFKSTFLIEADGVRVGMRKNPAEKILVVKLSEAVETEEISASDSSKRRAEK